MASAEAHPLCALERVMKMSSTRLAVWAKR
jgi:hypothetical protein